MKEIDLSGGAMFDFLSGDFDQIEKMPNLKKLILLAAITRSRKNAGQKSSKIIDERKKKPVKD